MSRFTGSLWKKSRRYGISLTGTGKELERRPYAPGQHGPTQRKKLSEYGLQLQEKQNYVICSELQNVNSATRSLLQVT